LSDRCRGLAVQQGGTVERERNIVNPVIGESSNIIQEVDVYSTDVGLVSFFNTDEGDFADTNTADDIFIEVYNNSTLLNSYTLAISDATGTRPPTSSSIDGLIAHFGGYPANSIMNLFTNVGNPTWTHYRFRLSYDGGSASNWIQFRRRTGVCKADAKRLAWSNRWGGWDYFWFDGSAEYILDAERKTYRKIRGSYSGTTYTHNYYDAGTANFYNNVEKGYKIMHSSVSAEERILLENLFRSQNVYIFDQGLFLPCTVSNANYTRQEKQSRNFEVSFDLKLAYDVNS
jgi:hypothetical protein